MNPLTLLEADNLTLLKGSSLLLRHYSLHIAAGQIIHLTGDNGSGKTTLTARENLRYAARLYHGMHGAELETRLDTALAAVALHAHDDRQSRHLSAGQQRRCQLARLWLDTPPLWLLDEPLTALDATTTATLLAHLEQHRQHGGAAIITSHQPLDLPVLETRHLPGQ